MNPKKKMGRPTDDPKVFNAKIRLSSEDEKMLEYCIARTGKTKADIIRMGIKEIFRQLQK